MSMKLTTENPSSLDRLGIWISSLCAVHCLLIPILPLLASSVVGQNWFEKTILTLSMLIGSIALISGMVRHHGRAYPIALLISGGAIYWFKDMFGHDWEPLTITIGASLIVSAHLINMRLSHRCRCCHHKVVGELNPAAK